MHIHFALFMNSFYMKMTHNLLKGKGEGKIIPVLI
jgi:hypothetical protein